MNVGKLLKSVGGAVLKNVPMGGLIYDIADAVLDDEIPQDVTGDQLTEMLGSLPPEQYTRVMEKQLDTDLKKYETWAELQKKMQGPSAMTDARAIITVMAAACVFLIITAFAGIIAYDYVVNGTDIPWQTVTFLTGIPALVTMVAFGVKPDKMLDVALAYLIKKYR